MHCLTLSWLVILAEHQQQEGVGSLLQFGLHLESIRLGCNTKAPGKCAPEHQTLQQSSLLLETSHVLTYVAATMFSAKNHIQDWGLP